ncbi:MAG: IclR family transcriptional regulator [Chloroflexota bacterium]|nr:MAG: IclR family transcriptional regulator [Chloroflexota bacterium]
MLQTIYKASEVLSLFDHCHTEWGVREVATQLQLAKSSTHDLLASLAQVGLLSKTEEGRYRLGWRLVAMSETLLSTTELCLQAHPVMEDLVARYRETVHLAVLDDAKVIYVDKLEGNQAVRVESTQLGSPLQPHCVAAGKVLLAYQPEGEVDHIIQNEDMQCFTSNTITDRNEFSLALEKVRKQGYAYDLEELLPDLCGVSAPIFNHSGKVIAAIGMSIPVYRFLRYQADFRMATIEAAKIISERLGFGRE